MISTRNSSILVLCADTFFIAVFVVMFGLPTAGQQVQQSISFLPPAIYVSGCTLNAVAVGDLDGDGHPDLVVANWYEGCSGVSGPGNVGVLLSNGDGTFKTAANYFSGGVQALGVAVGDLNADGRLDVVVANSCPDDGQGTCSAGLGQIGVLLGNGDGTLQPVVSYYSGGGLPNAVAISDLNEDGHLDLVIDNYCQPVQNGLGCSSPGSVGVLLGLGDGTFQPAATYETGENDVNTSLAVDDLNSDGHPDAVVTSGQDTGVVNVLVGNGDGTFRLPVSYGPVGYEPNSVAIGDVNGDGHPDLAVAAYCQDLQGPCNTGTVAVLMGEGDGSFLAPTFYSSGAFNALSVAIEDMNDDGHRDLVVTNDHLDGSSLSPGSVAVLLGRSDGTFQAPVDFLSGGANPRAVLAADVNGDGKPDVVAANFCPRPDKCDDRSMGTIGVLLNNTPFCTSPPVITLSATPASLWPPNGKMVPVLISGMITAPGTGCTLNSAAYAVKDEYGKVQPSGQVTLGPGGAYSFSVLLQASRFGADMDGRLYTVTVNATNNGGKTGSQPGSVIVPHDQRH
jgi:hypothetical protein